MNALHAYVPVLTAVKAKHPRYTTKIQQKFAKRVEKIRPPQKNEMALLSIMLERYFA